MPELFRIGADVSLPIFIAQIVLLIVWSVSISILAALALDKWWWSR